MASAIALKLETEAKLASQIPRALSPQARQVPRLQPTGVAAVDDLLHGGLPLGSLCELTGPALSGWALGKASATAAYAYMDVGDSLHPYSAAAARGAAAQPALGAVQGVREHRRRAGGAFGTRSGAVWRPGGDALLVLLTQEPCARSSVAGVLWCAGATAGASGRHVLTGMPFQAEVARQRTGAMWGKKLPSRVGGWQAAPTWMRAAGQ